MRQIQIIHKNPGKAFREVTRMEQHEIQLGDATYHLSRIFNGSKLVKELLVDAVLERARAEISVDEVKKPAV